MRGTKATPPFNIMACLLADDSLELTPQQRAFLEAWAKRLNVSVEVLIERIVASTIDGFLYIEKIPDYRP